MVNSTLPKIALAALTVVLMASMGGGFLLLPLLAPLHVWAARTSGPVGRVLWSLLPGAAAGMVVWAAVYLGLGEVQPLIWLVPFGAAVAAVSATVLASTGRTADYA